MNEILDEDAKSQSLPKKVKRAIVLISVLIPVVVTVLLLIPAQEGLSPESEAFFRSLPPFYASINGITAALLIVALIAIKRGKVQLHRNVMSTCLVLSLLFLVCYIAYHFTIPSTKFGGEGTIKLIYVIILLSHILLSVITVPLVLISYVLGFSGLYARHKRLARITYPIWLYVAISGVMVYLMISPYYPS